FQLPVFAMFPYMLSGVALGAAEGLIDDFTADMVGRSGKMTGARISEVQSVQIRIGEAAAYARASRVMQEANCREAQALAVESKVPDLKNKGRHPLPSDTLVG